MSKAQALSVPRWMRLLIVPGLALSIGLISSNASAAETYTTFAVPNAKNTYAYSINSSDEVAGIYQVTKGKGTGYIRSADGSINSFLCPDAEEVSNAYVNDSGTVGGSCGISSKGYLRAADGMIETFQVAGSSTTVVAINGAGDVTGTYNGTGTLEGFVRGADGKIKTFSISGGNSSTLPNGINGHGEIVGTYVDDNIVLHGFYRSKSGAITVFDAPGAGSGSAQGTSASAINAKGVIAGTFTDANSQTHGFILQQGEYVTFDAATVANINDKNQAIGLSTIYWAFIRSAKGDITTFEVPHYQRAAPYATNNFGRVAGTCYDRHKHRLAGVGFIRTP